MQEFDVLNCIGAIGQVVKIVHDREVVGQASDRIVGKVTSVDRCISTRATFKVVITRTTFKVVITRTAIECIIAAVARDLVIAIAARERVVARITINCVVARSTDEGVVPVASVERDRTRAFHLHGVIVGGAVDGCCAGDVEQAVSCRLARLQSADLHNARVDSVTGDIETGERHWSVRGGIVQVAHEDGVSCRGHSVAGHVHVHRHAGNHRSRAAIIENDTADHIAHGVARDVNVVHAALAETDDAQVCAADRVVADDDVGDCSVAH